MPSHATPLRLRAGQAVSGCRVAPKPAKGWSRERLGAPAQSKRGKAPAAPPRDAPCDCAQGRLHAQSAALGAALIGAGGNAQHRTGRFQSGPSGMGLINQRYSKLAIWSADQPALRVVAGSSPSPGWGPFLNNFLRLHSKYINDTLTAQSEFWADKEPSKQHSGEKV